MQSIEIAEVAVRSRDGKHRGNMVRLEGRAVCPA